jgi:oxaloacetate decarboxylase gamma subunit
MLLAQGLELLLYGMGTVLVFLTLLVVATRSMSAVVRRWFPEPELLPEPRVPEAAADAEQLPPQLLAAIGSAVHRFRRERR